MQSQIFVCSLCKVSFQVFINPVVQACSDGPMFHAGWGRPHRVPINSCWVLRLPLIYCGEGGAHLPPRDAPAAGYGRLLKAVLTAQEGDTSAEMKM